MIRGEDGVVAVAFGAAAVLGEAARRPDREHVAAEPEIPHAARLSPGGASRGRIRREQTSGPAGRVNIVREYTPDLGDPMPAHGDLSPWAGRGVRLLNRVLTVQPGRPAAHRGAGWEEVTDQAIRALAARGRPLVAILWGRDARSLVPLLDGVPRIESAHPSPMSADRGFFGSRPFSRANRLLEQQGAPPVDWKLP